MKALSDNKVISFSAIFAGPVILCAAQFAALCWAYRYTSVQDVHLIVASMLITLSAAFIFRALSAHDLDAQAAQSRTALLGATPFAIPVFYVLRTVWPRQTDAMLLSLFVVFGIWLALHLVAMVRLRRVRNMVHRLEEQLHLEVPQDDQYSTSEASHSL